MTHNCQRIVNKYLFCFMVMGHCFRFQYNRTGSVLQKFTDETIPEGSALLWKGTWIKCDRFLFTVLWYGCMNDMCCNWDLYFGGERRDLETNAYIMKISLTKLWQTPTEAYHDLTGTTFITSLVNPINQWICGPSLPQRWKSNHRKQMVMHDEYQGNHFVCIGPRNKQVKPTAKSSGGGFWTLSFPAIRHMNIPNDFRCAGQALVLLPH